MDREGGEGLWLKGEGRMGRGGGGDGRWMTYWFSIHMSYPTFHQYFYYVMIGARGCELKCTPIYLVPVIGHQRDKVCIRYIGVVWSLGFPAVKILFILCTVNARCKKKEACSFFKMQKDMRSILCRHSTLYSGSFYYTYFRMSIPLWKELSTLPTVEGAVNTTGKELTTLPRGRSESSLKGVVNSI